MLLGRTGVVSFVGTHVAKLGASYGCPNYWPAMPLENGAVMIDLRLFETDAARRARGLAPLARTSEMLQVVDPVRLREAGISDLYIEQALLSEPPGFVTIKSTGGG